MSDRLHAYKHYTKRSSTFTTQYTNVKYIYIQSIMSKTESNLHYYPSRNHKNFEHQATLSWGIVFPPPFYLLPLSQAFFSFPLQALTVTFKKVYLYDTEKFLGL